AGLDIIQLREATATEGGWPKSRVDYEARYGKLGGEPPKEGDAWPQSAEEFGAKFGYPAGSVSTLVSHDKDHKIEIHLKSKGDQILDGIKSKLGVGIVAETASVQWIGPSSSDELRNSAFKSIFVALFFIMAYIALRFDLRFAPGAIVSLAHDVLIAIGAM